MVRAGGTLRTDSESLSGEGEVVTRTARGGNGYSVDIGLIYETYSHILIGAYVLNTVSAMKWTHDCREEINGLIADNVTFGASDLDSLVDDYHESRHLASFSTGLAPVIGLGIDKDLGWTYMALRYTQGLRQGAFTSGGPRISVSGAWSSIWVVDLMAGLAYEAGFGFDEQVQVGFGQSPRLEVGAGFSPLPYASAMKQVEVYMGMSFRL